MFFLWCGDLGGWLAVLWTFSSYVGIGRSGKKGHRYDMGLAILRMSVRAGAVSARGK